MATRKESREVVKTVPARPLTPFEEMDRMFDAFLRRPFSMFAPSLLTGTRMPAMKEMSPNVDMYEDGGDVVLKAELPGMGKDDIEVNLAEGSVTISGEKKREEKVEEKDYHTVERSWGKFTRSFALPRGVKAEEAKARFKDGVLEVRIPKTEEAKKKEKKITVE